MQMKLISVLALLAVVGCESTKTTATATESTLCRVWGESLPTRSHVDTAQTQSEIEAGYDDFAAACPEFDHLVPS